MEKWFLYATGSMMLAGITAVIAKLGLAGISPELGLSVRTVGVFVLIMAFGMVVVPKAEIGELTRANLGWLGLSAVTTSLSWVLYYKAIKEGNVSTVALIDKGSVIVAVLLATVVLKEALTPQKLVGGAMMIAGMVVIAREP